MTHDFTITSSRDPALASSRLALTALTPVYSRDGWLISRQRHTGCWNGMMRELHSGRDPHTELKPLTTKTAGERGETVGCVCERERKSVRAPVHDRKGVAVSPGDVTSFPESQNNRWLR